MARLNEPTIAAPAVESIEMLKRKFLRQNREIAKVNSTQAMRIRALENEVSRLLTDNLNSRGYIIRLERDLESSRSRHQHVDDLRSQMQVKLAELGALFSGFDGRPSPKKRRSISPKERNKVIRSTPTKSPGTKDWKNVCALGEAMPGQEGRFPPSLPAIMENKYYPRKTLEQDELAALKEAADTTDSPELEPPPTSQFIDENPVKIDLPVKILLKPEVEVPTRSTSPTKFTTAMLDQRRKRRESVGITEIRRLSGDEAMVHEVTPDSLKVGAKRKISVRDDEEPSSSSHVAPDEFKFTRKIVEEQAPTAVTNSEKVPATLPREIAIARESSRERTKSATIQISGRRALAPKQSNEDLSNSPRKKTKPPVHDDISMAKKDHSKAVPLLERPRSRSRPNKIQNIPPKPVQPSVVCKIDVLLDEAPALEPEAVPEALPQREPETPAAQEIISPPFSESSTRPSTRDTPPPTDISNGSVLDHSRPGRRARASVSYAEPNLRDKMRRPTKELVDAVQKQTTYIKIEDGESETNPSEKSSGKAVYIKPEPLDDDPWPSMATGAANQDPPSPLSGKAPMISDKTSPNDLSEPKNKPVSSIPPTSTSNLRDSDTVSNRRARIEKIEQPKLSRSAPPLIASTSTRHSRHQAISGLDKDLPKTDIYDFQPTSPEPKEQIRKFVALEESAASRNKGPRFSGTEESSASSATRHRGTVTHFTRKNSSSKRNSALPLQMVATDSEVGDESDVEGPRKTDITSRRRSVAACSSSLTSSSSSGLELRSGNSSGDIERGAEKKGGADGNIEPREKLEVSDGGTRQERINARRRSMML